MQKRQTLVSLAGLTIPLHGLLSCTSINTLFGLEKSLDFMLTLEALRGEGQFDTPSIFSA